MKSTICILFILEVFGLPAGCLPAASEAVNQMQFSGYSVRRRRESALAVSCRVRSADGPRRPIPPHRAISDVYHPTQAGRLLAPIRADLATG